MKKSGWPWWIKVRMNPQLGTYYVACGQMSMTAAKRFERPKYGANVMLPFASEADYRRKIEQLQEDGHHVQ